MTEDAVATARRAFTGTGTRAGLMRRFSRSWLTYGVGSFVQRGIAFLLLPIYAKWLTPAELGTVGVVLALFSGFAVVFGLGLRGAVTRQYFDHVDAPERLREYVGSVYTAFVLAGGACAALLTIFGRSAFEWALPQVPFSPFVPLALWAAFCSAAGGIVLSLYRAREQALRYVALESASALALLVSVGYFVVVRQGGAVGQARGLFWSSVAIFAVSIALLAREAAPRLERRLVRSALAFGLPLTVHLLAGWALLAIDRVLLARMVSLDEVGWYTFGYQIAMVMSVVATASNAAWAPLFYDLARRRDDAPSVLGELASLNVAVSFGVGLLLILFGREVVAVLGGPDYAPASSVVPVIVIGCALQALYFVTVTPIFFAQRTRLLAPLTLGAAVVNVAVNLLLIPRYGIHGAAWATVLAFAFLFVTTSAAARRYFAVRYEVRTLVVLSALIGAASVVTWASAAMPPAAGWGVRAGMVGLYLVTCMRTGITTRLKEALPAA